MKNSSNVRRGRIPLEAQRNGLFVVDFGWEQMVPVNFVKQDRSFPVYDGRDGSSVGNLKMSDILRKMF